MHLGAVCDYLRIKQIWDFQCKSKENLQRKKLSRGESELDDADGGLARNESWRSTRSCRVRLSSPISIECEYDLRPLVSIEFVLTKRTFANEISKFGLCRESFRSLCKSLAFQESEDDKDLVWI